MQLPRGWPSLVLLSSLVFACGPVDGPADTSGSGGTPMTGGSPGAGGAISPSGGGPAVGGGLVNVGGQATGGNSSATGGVATPSGGAVSTVGGAPAGGGVATGGVEATGGAEATGGSGGGTAEPVKSAGCGKANPQLGSSGQPLNTSGHNYYVKLPNGYNPDTPYKVIIMFPPTGNTIDWSEKNAGYEQAAPDAIRVYTHMANQSNGWQPNETSFFPSLHEALTSNFCIDESRIFAAGESSGGEFAGFVGCEYGDLVRGVAPGAPKATSWQINPSAHGGCKGHPVAIVIWSEKDNVLQQPAGADFRDFYHDLNTCGDTSTAVDGFTDVKSNCKKYDGCMPGSDVYWCQHEDPNYSNTYHGWPLMGGKMTWQEFSKY